MRRIRKWVRRMNILCDKSTIDEQAENQRIHPVKCSGHNSARFFHDSQMDETEISEFCDNIETKLLVPHKQYPYERTRNQLFHINTPPKL